MSNIHTYMDAGSEMAPASDHTTGAIVSLAAAVTGPAARLLATLKHNWTMQDIARFSDHRLRDMGFERDWDGSVIPMQR